MDGKVILTDKAMLRLIETIVEVRSRFSNPEELNSPSWLDESYKIQASGLRDLESPLIDNWASPVFSNSDVFEEIKVSAADETLIRDTEGNPFDVQPQALAWYKSFRYRDWGIYIRITGIDKLAKQFKSQSCTPFEARQLAFNFLFEHEFTHFRTDLTVAGLELLSNVDVWSNWRSRLRANKTYSLISEGLCNSHAYYKTPKQNRADLEKWLLNCPPGYSNFRDHRNSALGRHDSWSNLLAEISNAGVGSFSPYQPQVSYLKKFIPLYFVYEKTHAVNASPDTIFFIGAMNVVEGENFEKSLKKTGNSSHLSKKWQKAKHFLQQGNLTRGLNLEHYSKEVFTVRVDQQVRAMLERKESYWLAVEISQDHDGLNKRASRA